MPMSFADALLRYPRTPGAAQSLNSGNLAAPNAGAVQQAVPMPGAPSPSDMGNGLPPEIAALISQYAGQNGGPQALPQPPMPQGMPMQGGMPPDPGMMEPPPDPMQMLSAVAEQAFQSGSEMGAAAAQAAAPNPDTAPTVGAPAIPAPPTAPMGLGPEFRTRFMQQEGRFPTVSDISDEAYSRDFFMRTGKTPTKLQLIARLGPPAQPQGISEFQ